MQNMTEEKNHSSNPAALQTAKLGIWGFLATEVLLFGALFTN
jgi:heme/copper-type cytochrome/quinol oxidase subunit 3